MHNKYGNHSKQHIVKDYHKPEQRLSFFGFIFYNMAYFSK